MIKKNRKVSKRLLAITLSIIMIIGLTMVQTPVVSNAASGGYSARLSAPTKSNKYYYSSKNVFYKCGYGMPNCTAYAFGRAYELLGTEPKLSHHNAGQWYDYNKKYNYYKYGKTPKVGAIAVWAKDNSHDKGHVAVVEAVNGSNITISESHYKGVNFNTRCIKKDSSNYLKSYKFLGYIYVYDSKDKTAPTASNIRVTGKTSSGYTVTCNVSDKGGSGISKVMVATWTSKNGQDDLKWAEAKISGNTATYSVKVSDHKNESGTYYSHIYVCDNAENVKGYSNLGAITVPVKKATSKLTEPSKYVTVKPGVYELKSRLNTSKVVDVYGGGTKNGTNIKLYADHSGENQKFRIDEVKSGWYKITSIKSDKVLDVQGGKIGKNVNVQLWEYNGTDAQLWRFYSTGDGYYYIKNKLGYYLDIAGGKATEGANIHVYSYHSGKAQQWRVVKAKDCSSIDVSYAKKLYPDVSYWNGNYKNKAWQCHGFALTVANKLTGSDPLTWKKAYSLNNIKAGDILRFQRAKGPHTILITSVNGSTITYVDCNWYKANTVKWDQRIDKSKLAGKFGSLQYVLVRP